MTFKISDPNANNEDYISYNACVLICNLLGKMTNDKSTHIFKCPQLEFNFDE